MSLPNRTVRFWLEQDPERYFNVTPAFDREIKDKFEAQVKHALTGKYFAEWTQEGWSCLALILLLDQFPRNIYRDTPKMYFGDSQALVLAHLALAKNYYDTVPAEARRWLLMPLMHSENLRDQELCVELCKKLELEDTLPFAREHKEIIEKFGRFPHRNEILGRESTKAEQTYLAGGGFQG